MTRRGLSLVAALLVASAIPAAAHADTRVVLQNESRDTEVVTGEARVVNGGTTKSGSTAVGAESAVVEQQGAPVTQAAGAQTVAPTDTASSPVVEPTAQAVQQVAALFVGLPTGTTISP